MIRATEAYILSKNGSFEDRVRQALAGIDLDIKNAAKKNKFSCEVARIFVDDDLYKDIIQQLQQAGYTVNTTNTEIEIKWGTHD